MPDPSQAPVLPGRDLPVRDQPEADALTDGHQHHRSTTRAGAEPVLLRRQRVDVVRCERGDARPLLEHLGEGHLVPPEEHRPGDHRLPLADDDVTGQRDADRADRGVGHQESLQNGRDLLRERLGGGVVDAFFVQGEDPSAQVRDRGVQAVLRELDAEELPLPTAHLQEPPTGDL